MKLIRPLNARFHCLSSGADDARVAGGGDRLEWSVRPQGWGPATAGRRRDGVQMMFPDGGSRDEEVGGKEGRAKHGQDDGEEASKGNFEARKCQRGGKKKASKITPTVPERSGIHSAGSEAMGSKKGGGRCGQG